MRSGIGVATAAHDSTAKRPDVCASGFANAADTMGAGASGANRAGQGRRGILRAFYFMDSA